MTIPKTETVAVPIEVRTRSRFVVPLVVLAIVVAALVIGGLSNDAFLTATNILAILRSAAITGIVALGATFITISGRFFSLALGQTAVFSAVLFAILLQVGLPFAIAALLTLAAAIVWGAAQGGIVAMGANPIITTLGAGALLAAVSGVLTNGKSIRIHDDAVAWLGNARPLGVPTQTWTFLVLIVVAVLIMRFTRFGRETLLIGANRATAASSGISVARVTVAVFSVASITAAIAGMFAAAQFEQARISEFSGLDFDVVAAVLVGGTAIQGGNGSPLRTAIGAVFIAIVQNYMVLLGVSFGVRTVVLGALVLIAVAVFHLLNRRSGGAS